MDGNLQNLIQEFSRSFTVFLSFQRLMHFHRELLKTFGVSLIVDDLYSLDPEALSVLQPLHALIFLFKWLPSSTLGASTTALGEPDPAFPGFFAHQVVNNACATLAVMNAIGNIPDLPMSSEYCFYPRFCSRAA